MSARYPPLREAVEQYLAKKRARFHMPGHKGAPLGVIDGAARYDITELPGTGSLYESGGPIAETEARYSALYGSAGSFLSAGGSTLCIQAMLALAAPPGGTVICGRGVHASALNAMALLDLRPVWLWPELDEAGFPHAITAAQVRAALKEHPNAAAVYLTSPNYFGTMSDITAVSAVCHAGGVPLLVDNAHGPHLKFMCADLHPVSLGADMCCDSLHKTLPVLTGGAMLHIANSRYLSDAKRRMSLFGSTSPSYLIMLSADGALPWLESSGPDGLCKAARCVAWLETLVSERGLPLAPALRDPLRLAFGFSATGLDADGIYTLLTSRGVEPEYISGAFCVLIAGAHNTEDDFGRLEAALTALPAAARAASPPEPPPRPAAVLTPREATLAPCETVETAKAEGRICAGTVAPCPPGIPVAAAGELLNKNLCGWLERTGILTVNVIK